MEQTNKERFFSVELKSRTDIRNVTVDDSNQENVLIEGSIGNLLHAEFADEVVLEVFGEKGVLRVSLTLDDIKKTHSEVKK